MTVYQVTPSDQEPLGLARPRQRAGAGRRGDEQVCEIDRGKEYDESPQAPPARRGARLRRPKIQLSAEREDEKLDGKGRTEG
jgi:hypothetical protein